MENFYIVCCCCCAGFQGRHKGSCQILRCQDEKN